MTPRETLLGSFLVEAGWGDARTAPLAGDASNRRYLRLDRDGMPAVLMDAPPEKGEDIRPFVAVTNWLRARGYAAPEILAEDVAYGFLLLEDLGDALYARAIEDAPALETPLYAAAVDLLADLARRAPPGWLPPYDRAVLDREAALFAEWWLPAVGAAGGIGAATDLAGLMREATTAVEPVRETVVLRDYHAENLLWLPDRTGLARVGLLDYQDALAGHPTYDLMSLLEDARRDTSEELQQAMIARYLAARPELEPDAFRAAYAALGAQRNLKIVGIFARLALRDGKPRYLSLIPRVWRHLQRDVSHPGLTAVRAWLDRHAPEPTPTLLSAIAGSCAP